MLFSRQYLRPLRPSVPRRWREGISLWLAVLLMLSVHPLYAEAGSLPAAEPSVVSHVCRSAASAGGARVPANVVMRWLWRKQG